jgi:5-methyltetrahydrofolate--homocysteine methyltransferase
LVKTQVASFGIPKENIVIDPLVLTVGTDSNTITITLEEIRLESNEFGVDVYLGAASTSFDYPTGIP